MGKNKTMGSSKKVKKLSASKLAEFFRTKSLLCDHYGLTRLLTIPSFCY